MNNITTLHPINTLTVGEIIKPTTSTYEYTVLAASIKYPKREGTRTTWVALLVNSNNKLHPFTTHLVIDTENGWACESGRYHYDISDALADFAERGGQVK
jgi:hypothetical protein